MNVRVAPGVVVVPAADIFFPPVDLPDGVNPLTAGIPGITPDGVGPFTIAEIADRVALNEPVDTSGAATSITTYLPWVLRGPAPTNWHGVAGRRR